MKDFLRFFALLVIALVVIFFISQPNIRSVFKHSQHKVQKEKVKKDTLSPWIKANASYYDPLDPRQTKDNPDGIGSFNRKIRSGSIALGSVFTKTYREKGLVVFIEVDMDSVDIITPYGKNIFRVDDVMAKKYRLKDKYYVDFFHKDLNDDYKRLGRFDIKFRIVKIQKKQLSYLNCFFLLFYIIECWLWRDLLDQEVRRLLGLEMLAIDEQLPL